MEMKFTKVREKYGYEIGNVTDDKNCVTGYYTSNKDGDCFISNDKDKVLRMWKETMAKIPEFDIHYFNAYGEYCHIKKKFYSFFVVRVKGQEELDMAVKAIKDKGYVLEDIVKL